MVLPPVPGVAPAPRLHPRQPHPALSVASATASPRRSHANCSSQLCSPAPHSSSPLNSQLGDGQTTMGCGGCPFRAATQPQWRGHHLTVMEPVREAPGAGEAHPAPGSTVGLHKACGLDAYYSASQCLCTRPFHPNTTYLYSRKSHQWQVSQHMQNTQH